MARDAHREARSAAERSDVQRIATYLARRDAGPPTVAHGAPTGVRADVLVLCGSAVLATLETAARALHSGVVPRILVSGGVGHSTDHLRRTVREHPRYGDVATGSRSEAAIIAEVLRRHHGVPAGAVSVEEASGNCGENARFSVDLLREAADPVRSVLLVQDPTMQRRTHESFRCSLVGWPEVRLSSHAPFVPAVPDLASADVTDDEGRPAWSTARFVGLVLGEVRRLHDDQHGYGPRGAGFIGHVDVPDAVLGAWRRLTAGGPDGPREAFRS